MMPTKAGIGGTPSGNSKEGGDSTTTWVTFGSVVGPCVREGTAELGQQIAKL